MAITWEQLHVLVVEDEPFMREILAQLLRDIGAKKVFFAADGLEGLKKALILGDKLGLVLVDLEMPVMGGLDFLKRLRAAPAPVRADAPAVVLTGHSDSDNVKQAVRLGIHGFLIKPVSAKALQERMTHALTKPQVPSAKANQIV